MTQVLEYLPTKCENSEFNLHCHQNQKLFKRNEISSAVSLPYLLHTSMANHGQKNY
jgi:hypothetical protein